MRRFRLHLHCFTARRMSVLVTIPLRAPVPSVTSSICPPRSRTSDRSASLKSQSSVTRIAPRSANSPTVILSQSPAAPKLLRGPQVEENARTCAIFSSFPQRKRKSRTVWRRGRHLNPRGPSGISPRNSARVWPSIQASIKQQRYRDMFAYVSASVRAIGARQTPAGSGGMVNESENRPKTKVRICPS